MHDCRVMVVARNNRKARTIIKMAHHENAIKLFSKAYETITDRSSPEKKKKNRNKRHKLNNISLPEEDISVVCIVILFIDVKSVDVIRHLVQDS